MALSKERHQELMDILERTSMRPKGAKAPEYPQEYKDYRTLCTEEIVKRTVDDYEYTFYIYRAKNRTENCPIHINIHGGGFVAPHMECDTLYSCYLADRLGGIVVDLDYTTSPVAPWPVAFDQCYDASAYTFVHCAEWGGSLNCVSIGGYSAGGVLAAGVALKAGQTGDFRFNAQVLGYPPLDNIIDPDYKKDSLTRVLPRERELAFSALYFADDREAMAHPYGSPSYAPDEMLAKLPRTLVITAGSCNFRFEDEEYAQRVAHAGVEVVVKRFPEMFHGFIPHLMGQWKEAADLIVRTVRVEA